MSTGDVARTANLKVRTNFDASFDGMWVEAPTTHISIHNGCDNSYGFIFVTDDLRALAEGKLQNVHGLLEFFDPYQEGEEGRDRLETTTSVTCALFTGKIE